MRAVSVIAIFVVIAALLIYKRVREIKKMGKVKNKNKTEGCMGIINQCTMCGKKGFFLPLNRLGHCEECIKKIKAEMAKKEQEQAAKQAAERAAKRAALEEARRKEQENTKRVPNVLGGERLAYFYTDVKIFTKLCLPQVRVDLNGAELQFKQEPENEYDKKAVAIYTMSGEKIGYLYKGKIQDMVNDYLRLGLPVWGAVSLIDTDDNRYEIAITFYRSGHGMDAEQWDDDEDYDEDYE